MTKKDILLLCSAYKATFIWSHVVDLYWCATIHLCLISWQPSRCAWSETTTLLKCPCSTSPHYPQPAESICNKNPNQNMHPILLFIFTGIRMTFTSIWYISLLFYVTFEHLPQKHIYHRYFLYNQCLVSSPCNHNDIWFCYMVVVKQQVKK